MYHMMITRKGLTLKSSGDASITGNLDVGSGSSSKINVHAANNGYTGYAELKAQSSYDMYLNLSTAYPNGGCTYFKINGDSYMQLSGSNSKVNIHIRCWCRCFVIKY